MSDPKEPLPGETPEFNPDDETSGEGLHDPQIDRVLNDAEADDLNNLIERAVTGGDGDSYREPVNPQRHNAMRNAMLEQYYHYRHPYLRDTRSPGEDFEVAEELDDLLEQIKVVVDEWHRKPGGDERNEAVRVLELPLIQSLALRVISPKDRDRIIDMLDDFITMGDDTRAKKEAKELRDRLKED